jgi:hypothetical protein
MNKLTITLLLSVAALSVGCTQDKKAAKQVVVYTKEFADPQKVILQAKIDAAPAVKKKAPKKNVLIWTLSDKAGQTIAAALESNVSLPFTVLVKTPRLLGQVQEGAPLLFTARMMDPKDQYKPPVKGQLSASYGDIWDDAADAEVTPAVKLTEKQLEKVEKTQEKSLMPELKRIKPGDSIEVELKPVQ